VSPGTSEDMDALVRETPKLPQEVAMRIGKMMQW